VPELLLHLGLGEARGADLARAHEGEPLAHRQDERRGLPLGFDALAGGAGHEGRHVLDAGQLLGLGEPRALAAAGIDADRLQLGAERPPARVEPARAADVEQAERVLAERARDQRREGAVHRVR